MKGLSQVLAEKADLILIMEAWMKRGLPVEKTYTLKEYASETGDIPDPIGGTIPDYLRCAEEMTRLLTSVAAVLK